MSVDCQDKVQALGELVRNRDYEIDPVAVADAILQRFAWDDVPQVELLGAEVAAERPPRLRGLVRVKRLASPVLARRTPLSA